MTQESADDRPSLLPALADSPGHLLWRAHARVAQALGEAPPSDLHAHAALLALADGAAHSQQELADLLATSRTTLARVAADLETAGLVVRARNPEDRRSYSLTRTAAGAEAARAWTTDLAEREVALSPGLTPAERSELAALLLRVLAAQDPAVDLPADLRTSVAFLVTRIHAHLHRTFSVALAPLDLEPRLFGALTALGATGPVPQHELARLLGTSSVSVVAMTDLMEERGLVVRRSDPADRRTHLVQPTERAPEVREQAAAVARASLAPLLDPLGGVGRARLVGLLRRFVTGE